MNEIYDRGLYQNTELVNFSCLTPQKSCPIECELHRKIRLTNHIIKHSRRIVMVGARDRIRPGTGIEQCGFIENTGARNAISTVHMLSE